MKQYYLTIAGFNILLQFNFHGKKLKLLEEIIDTYHGFMRKSRPEKINFRIKFYGRHFHQSILTLKKPAITGNKIFMLFFEEEKDLIKTFCHISLAQFLFLLIRALQKMLVHSHGFILHTSSSFIKRKAVLFTGRSGCGKSTAAMLLKDKYPILADDSLIIIKKRGQYLCYQSPAIEKNTAVDKNPRSYRLGKVFFLHKASSFHLKKLEDKNAVFSRLSTQLWTDKETVKYQLKYLLQFINEYSDFYQLSFSRNKKVMAELMKKAG